MSNKYADSMTLVVASTAAEQSSNFTRKYDPPILLDPDAHYEIALVRSLLWYTWFNISAAQSNNTVRLSSNAGVGWTVVTFADGTYSLSDIQTEITNVLVTTMGASATGVVLEPQHSTGKVRVELEAGYQFQFADLSAALQDLVGKNTKPNRDTKETS